MHVVLYYNVIFIIYYRIGGSYKIAQAVYSKYGLRGFYKGYFISLSVYAPHSALWWLFYDRYSGM